MAHANNMTTVLSKIERNLGLMPLVPHLPEKYGKDAWADTITSQTLDTFSRFFPWKVPFQKGAPTQNRTQLKGVSFSSVPARFSAFPAS